MKFWLRMGYVACTVWASESCGGHTHISLFGTTTGSGGEL